MFTGGRFYIPSTFSSGCWKRVPWFEFSHGTPSAAGWWLFSHTLESTRQFLEERYLLSDAPYNIRYGCACSLHINLKVHTLLHAEPNLCLTGTSESWESSSITRKMLFPTHQRCLSQRKSFWGRLAGTRVSWAVGRFGHQFLVPSFVFRGAWPLLVFSAPAGQRLHFSLMSAHFNHEACL